MTMKLKKRALLATALLAGLCCNTIFLSAQQATQPLAFDEALESQDESQVVRVLLEQLRGAEYPDLMERLYGDDAQVAMDVFNDEAAQLMADVNAAAAEKADEHLEAQVEEQANKKTPPTVVAPAAKPAPAKASTPTKPSTPPKPPAKPLPKKTPVKPAALNFDGQQKVKWWPLAFGFRLINQDDQKPEIKMTETDKEIKAEGSNKKNFETKDAKGTRTQKAATRYIKDGKAFGVEIRNTEIIEAVSKPDGKSFRKEISMMWGAQVAACPDVNGITEGTGQAKITAKTTYSEGGQQTVMTSDFDLKAKVTGHVNEKAELEYYDLVLDAYTENSGYEEALKRNLIKEIKIKDGRYGIHYDILRNTIEISDGKYGGKRTPAKMGKATAEKLTAMTDAETTVIGKAIGPMVPSIWNSANEMYTSAQRNWRNYGCVEVACTVPKTALKPGEEISIAAETVHLQDKTKINAEMTAEAYQGQVTPESQRANPTAKFTFTQDGEENASFYAQSISRRGIGKGDVEFQVALEKGEPQPGAWSGTIKAERKQREEREKRAGDNLAENGGYLQTTTNIQLQLTGRLDRTVEANNAHIASVSGEQQQVDFEYDKYKVDEGYCGENAVPYKGPKEITRTSTTTVNYTKQTRVYVEADRTNGTITFSLPEQNGTTVHKYVHKSPCPDHDRANTNEAKDEDAPGVGGNFSFSFPVNPNQKIVKGSTTVRDEDGTVTEYSWELTRAG